MTIGTIDQVLATMLLTTHHHEVRKGSLIQDGNGNVYKVRRRVMQCGKFARPEATIDSFGLCIDGCGLEQWAATPYCGLITQVPVVVKREPGKDANHYQICSN